MHIHAYFSSLYHFAYRGRGFDGRFVNVGPVLVPLILRAETRRLIIVNPPVLALPPRLLELQLPRLLALRSGSRTSTGPIIVHGLATPQHQDTLPWEQAATERLWQHRLPLKSLLRVQPSGLPSSEDPGLHAAAWPFDINLWDGLREPE